MNLSDSVDKISGVGPQYKYLLNAGNIYTVYDLLLTLPYKYETYLKKSISNLNAGENVTIEGSFSSIKNLYGIKSKYKITKGIFEDNTGKLEITWFNMPYITNSIPLNTIGFLSGKVEINPKAPRKLQIISPNWYIHENITDKESILPVYSSIQGISSKWISKKIDILLTEKFPEPLDDTFLNEFELLEFNDAVLKIHRPKKLIDKDKGRSRIAFEELLMLHLRGMKIRKDWESKNKGVKLNCSVKELTDIIENLPFALTDSQKSVVYEIINDLNSDLPMNRLLQGDVGTGKTIVAFLAMYAMSLEKHTSILIAPTQILAQQHYDNAKKLFSDKNIQINLVTGTSKDIQIEDTKQAQIYIGTHAIFHRMHKIEHAGLIIIDEQHKFGVSQRSDIIDHFTNKQNKITPNLLTMTATPIPRSMALAFYGDLNLSLINEYPKHRKLVKTWLINDQKRNSAYDWIKSEIKENGTQVFVICPFIEESEYEEFKDVKAAESEFINISKYFNENRVGLLHGKMKSAEKDLILNRFLNKDFDILVTTPVIEVGIDIPNANIIVIENPERMGLASIHQLRGRVGRGKDEGYCILISNSNTGTSRLKNLETIHNGNLLAEIDLKLRGPGNMYGTEQHGFLDLKVADITDVELIRKTKDAAIKAFSNPDKYPKINEIIAKLKYIGDD